MENNEIRAKLFALQDLKYKEFHSGLCPGTESIIGVRTPRLRELSREIAKGDIDAYLQNAAEDYYEELLLKGMVIGLIKNNLTRTCRYLQGFIPKIDNWAVCDITVTGLKITKKYQKEMLNFLKPYLGSEKEFELRFYIVMLLCYYITDDYIDMVLSVLGSVKHEGYYVKMAVAWALSVAFIKYPEKTMRLLKCNDIDDFTYNKALSKITDSYRVSGKAKAQIRKMRR
ncbi:MAG: DNA alkylation repair protein [Clostridia bacterium]|nr:DNA alkylation repair protein [Clostridia bacterium]